jgi:DNA-binding beta-propeller fold protein YncE
MAAVRSFHEGFRAVLLLAGMIAPAAAGPPTQTIDSDRNFPNVLAPLYRFGRSGSEPGSLRFPSGLAVGKDDLLYVADAGNHRVQMFALNGLPRGSFGSCGAGPSQFLFPSAVAAGPDGEIAVADESGRLQVFSAEGRFLRSWEGLHPPIRGIAFSKDRIYVAESELHRIRILLRKGGDAGIFGAPGFQPGQFISPAGVAVDEEGTVYVADSGNHRIQKLSPEGKPLGQWGAWGAQAGLLSYPAGVGYANGRISVADQGNHRVQVFDRNGQFVRQWGAPAPQVGDWPGRMHLPEGLAVTAGGGLTVVGEPLEDRIQVYSNRELAKTERVNDLPWWDTLHQRMHATRLAPPPPGSKPQAAGVLAAPDVHAVFFFDVATNALGPLTAAGGYGRKLGELNGIGGVAMDPDRGRAIVGDRGNRRLVIYEIPRNAARRELFDNSIKVVSSSAFDRLMPAAPAGYAPEAAVPGPMFRGGDGRIYILDRANASFLVCSADLRFEKLVPASPQIQEFAVRSDGMIVSTDPVRGQVILYDQEGKEKSSWGRRGEKGDDAFRRPYGVALDDQGFVYVSDPLQDAVLKFDRDGRFVKRWGARGGKPDQFSSPRRVTYYPPDRLLVEDYGNHRAQLCNTEGEFLGNYVSGGLSTPIAIR